MKVSVTVPFETVKSATSVAWSAPVKLSVKPAAVTGPTTTVAPAGHVDRAGPPLAVCRTVATHAPVQLTISTGGTSWASWSDARLPWKEDAKEITETLPSLDGYHLYEGINPAGLEEVYVKAQELNEVFPQCVNAGSSEPDYDPKEDNGLQLWSVFYDRLGAVALAYAKNHERAITELTARLAALETTRSR